MKKTYTKTPHLVMKNPINPWSGLTFLFCFLLIGPFGALFLLAFGADGYSLDWRVSMPEIARRLDGDEAPKVALQGNLDPVLLFAEPKTIQDRVNSLHASMNGRPGHIFNLGHGLLPDLPLSGIGAFVDAVKGLG